MKNDSVRRTNSAKKRCAHNFFFARHGNFGVIFAILAPILMVATGGMIDYTIFRSNAATLQDAADAAALAAAEEAIVQGWSKDVAQSVAGNFVDVTLSSAGLSKGTYSMAVTVDENDKKISIDLKQTGFDYLLIGLVKQAPYITASATAQAITDSNVCVVGLMQPQPNASANIHLDDRSRIDSPECGIFADSRHKWAFRIDSRVKIRANAICSAGGYYLRRSRGTLRAEPFLRYDCPRIGDPLASRPALSVGACDYTDHAVVGDAVLSPGVYCGGLNISGVGRVDLRPGNYIIKDGPLIVTDQIDLKGRGVGFYLTGTGSLFRFDADTSIRLEAPQTGPLAGLLFYEDRNVISNLAYRPIDLGTAKEPPNVRMHRMASNNARILVGTFYLPRGIFLINANAPVADRSAYTAIITNRLWLQEGPTLVLNADYAATQVPVPDGIGPRDKGVKLIK